MRKLRAFVVCGAAVALSWALPASALGAVVGDWQLNETSRPTSAVDGSGNGLHGNVGDDVVLGEATPTGGRAYRFRGDWWVVNDERLVLWGDNAQLDPGTGPYAVTIRIKTSAPNTNLIQKGQANQKGGFWKLEIHNSRPTCHFTDANRVTRAIGFKKSTNPAANVADGDWHTLRCERTTTGVRLTIDYGEPGAISNFLRGANGRVDNARPLALGGKVDCNGSSITCDYYAGAVDWLTIEKPGL
jgi:hypothetical protein